MKVHLYFNATVSGDVNLDALMPDISKRFPDSKTSIDNPYFGLKEITIKDPLKNLKIVKIKNDIECDIDVSFILSVFETLGYSYLDISFDLDEKIFHDVLKYNEDFTNIFFGESQLQLDGETTDFHTLLLPVFGSIFGQDVLSYHQNLEDDIAKITSRISEYKNKTHITPLIAGLDLQFSMTVNPGRYALIEDFDDELDTLPSWKNISILEGIVYQDERFNLLICKKKEVSKSFSRFNFYQSYNDSILSMLLDGARAWLKSLNKDVSSIRQNVSEDNSNPYYWKELKKKIEVMDLNFLEFNTYAVDKMDLKHGFHMKLELKDEYTDKIVESCRNSKKNLFKYLNEVRVGINNLSTPGHTHDEMFLQQETEKVNERILMLSFIAMSVPTIGALLSPGIPNLIKISAAIGVLMLPATYMITRNIMKKIKVNKHKKLEFIRLIEKYEKDLESADIYIESIEGEEIPSDFKEQLLTLSKEFKSNTKNKIEDLKAKL